MKKTVKAMYLRDKEKITLYFFPFVSFVALSLAYIAEFGFNLRPCVLCLYQRIPYYVVVVLSVFAYLAITKPNIKQLRKKELIVIFLSIYLLIFVGSAALAFYHTGVEKGIFHGPTTCSGEIMADNIEELREKILGGPIVPCNIPAFLFLSLSMAAWNGVVSIIVVAITIYALTLKVKKNAPRARRTKRKRKAR